MESNGQTKSHAKMKFNPNDPKHWKDFDPFAKAEEYVDGKSEAAINKAVANQLKNKSEEMRRKVSEGNLGRKNTDIAKLNMSKAQKIASAGKIPAHLFDPEIHKKAIEKQKGKPKPKTSIALKGHESKLKGRKRPELSDKLKGKPKSEEHKAKMCKPKIKSECPYCHMMVAPNIMSRFHGDKCKQK